MVDWFTPTTPILTAATSYSGPSIATYCHSRSFRSLFSLNSNTPINRLAISLIKRPFPFDITSPLSTYSPMGSNIWALQCSARNAFPHILLRRSNESGTNGRMGDCIWIYRYCGDTMIIRSMEDYERSNMPRIKDIMKIQCLLFRV